VNRRRQTQSRSHNGKASDFSIEKYGEKTAEKAECEEQLLAEHAMLLTFYLASVGTLTTLAIQQKRLLKGLTFSDLALIGAATHKLSRIIAKDRITGILRAPFVNYIRSGEAGEVEEEPRGHGIQRGIGQLISCPFCMAPWCATALGFGFLFAPRMMRLFAGILTSIAISDFLHRGYVLTKQQK
jgi:hypothetical protein